MNTRTLLFLVFLAAGCRQLNDRASQAVESSNTLKNRLTDSIDAYCFNNDHGGAVRYLDRIRDQVLETDNIGLISSWWRLRSKIASELAQHDSAAVYVQRAYDLTVGVD